MQLWYHSAVLSLQGRSQEGERGYGVHFQGVEVAYDGEMVGEEIFVEFFSKYFLL